MEPFFFGQQQQSFGAFHPAEGMPKQHGVLIAAPLLHEGTRAHFALRQISERCAAGGFDVLRFDYSGQGNSPGRSSDFTIRDWEDDLVTAADELAAVSGSQVKTVVAVRFAANLTAGLLSSKMIERLIMWDPVLSGDDWSARLYEHRAGLRESFRSSLGDTDYEFAGHETSRSFMSDLASRGALAPQGAALAAVISKDYCNVEALQQITTDIETVDFDCGWQNDTSAILYPTDIIRWTCSKVI